MFFNGIIILILFYICNNIVYSDTNTCYDNITDVGGNKLFKSDNKIYINGTGYATANYDMSEFLNLTFNVDYVIHGAYSTDAKTIISYLCDSWHGIGLIIDIQNQNARANTELTGTFNLESYCDNYENVTILIEQKNTNIQFGFNQACLAGSVVSSPSTEKDAAVGYGILIMVLIVIGFGLLCLYICCSLTVMGKSVLKD
mmetsp:Transcript_97094/g.118906  ORF Transcript_97094/g.118906 Transcript_97094/m.118906 type:complete len:200 (-) Transcript_97094:140-739(-)